MQLLYWLEPEDRAAYLSLLNCKPEKECGPAAGILRTNAIALDFGGSKFCSEYAAVCRDISLANHSCTPNAGYHSDQKTVTFELRADCDIESGEEICIRYTEILTTRDARLEELQTKYGFRCACSDCADTPKNIAKVRKTEGNS
ncbi:uncharacterized protein FOMMEDRAFT_22920 [Fomitiporia mediterranea MF3/22]|uniref:uncharacterized protein n=1 Tax=Fomitiporia mediterranea (strain MF3/22) TaxID=694068 RepID=UPI00044074CA|nr:uncharacterized protein FOMMEDRAFT_22920 [Fomitiporia mediterranea MF3/22]EJC99909.1 hypothetical protein FOMMEDRAFT_22920 [Fomitiporia mediterranea MF3/22]